MWVYNRKIVQRVLTKKHEAATFFNVQKNVSFSERNLREASLRTSQWATEGCMHGTKRRRPHVVN